MSWKPSNDLDVSEVLHSAVDDSHDHRYEDALKKFVWYHEASRAHPAMGGVRLSFALGYWMDLAEEYPPALDAFMQQRDSTEKRCLEGCGDFGSFLELSALNRCLDADRRTAEVFVEVARGSHENADRIYHVAERALVAQGLYSECGPFLEWENRLRIAIRAYECELEFEAAFHDGDRPPHKFARPHFQNESATLIALLSINNRRDEAEQVRDRCLAVLDDAEFRNALDVALTGHFPEGGNG